MSFKFKNLLFIPLLLLISCSDKEGCTDELACNFDSSSESDDGSCIYSEANSDCYGNCLTTIDCQGDCGGDAVTDCTGECDGNAVYDCLNECGGDASLDICGVCNSEGNTQELDCFVTDIDGNVYKNVQIGEQLWMAENLRVTRYRNGDDIERFINFAEPDYQDDPDNILWSELLTGAYQQYYGYFPELDDGLTSGSGMAYLDEVYGYLYNWYSVDDDRGICPEGWHVPTLEELELLIEYLGGESVAGGKMKKFENGANQTNESGFSALAGGYVHGFQGAFYDKDVQNRLWTSTDFQTYGYSHEYRLTESSTEIQITHQPSTGGYSIRCIKD